MERFLLFVDMLGVKSAWKDKDGAKAVKSKIGIFENLIFSSCKSLNLSTIKGGIDTDSAALAFNSPSDCLNFGIYLYKDAFLRAKNRNNDRIWLRGVIVGTNSNRSMREEFKTKISGITSIKYDDQLFKAINAEKSGFKGMRLLIADDLVDETLLNQTILNFGKSKMGIIKKLEFCLYPKYLPFCCSDVLWCLDTKPDIEIKIRKLRQRRLRWSAKDPEEFIHAAATYVLINETYAKLETLRKKEREK